MQKQINFTAFLQRYTKALEINLNTNKRIPIIKRACETISGLDYYLQQQLIELWTEKFSLSRKMLESFMHGDADSKLTPAEELREFLLSFEIKQNEITKEIHINRDGKQYTSEELSYIVDNEGYSNRHFEKFLNPTNKHITVTELFNPLKNFMFELADNYKGERLIAELADCIPAYDFETGQTKKYQKRLEYYLRKWLYKAVGQVLGYGTNDAMLLWIEPLGGSGKSKLNQWLFSLPEFKGLYYRVMENLSYFPAEEMAQKFCVDWDELPLKKSRYNTFKSTLAADGGQSYRKKHQGFGSYSRQVNYIGSTNKANRDGQKGFLLDDDDAMKRRIVANEISGRIDYEKYLSQIDLRQLWGEAAAGIIQAHKAQNKQLLTYECDYEELREYNRRYVNGSARNDYSLIRTKYKPADRGHGRHMPAAEILQELKQAGHKLEISPEQLGKFLAKHGYKNTKRRVSGWWVAEQ